MPFSMKEGLPFNEWTIGQIPESAKGVYGIYNSNTMKYVYIGKGEIRSRLRAHFNGSDGNPCILRSGPTHFVYDITSNADALETELIRDFSPPCNTQKKP